jgi:nicotinate-nucleotide pyrophosphorylase
LPDGLPIGRARDRAPIAASGVDLISSRWIIHRAPILDLGVDIA